MPLGMPTYMASGGHYFGQSRYRFLILPRYDFDLHSIIRNRQVDTKNILIIATQLLDILEHIHDCGYAHSDIKAENIMIGKCSYKKGGTKTNGGKLNASNKQGGGKGGGAAAATVQSAADKRKINRRLRMTLVSNESAASDGHRQSSKRTKAKSKSYAESDSSFSSNKSDDSDFSEDFEKLSEEDDEDEDDEDEEMDEEDDSDNEEDENDSGMCVCERGRLLSFDLLKLNRIERDQE